MNAIEVRNLTKSYGDVEVIRNLTLDVPCGALYGFLGLNGAGKTTTIDCLTGLTDYDGGEIAILGKTLRENALEIKQKIGTMPDNLALFDYLTAEEFLIFQARMFGVGTAEAERRVSDLMEALELRSEGASRLLEYSTGMRKKVAFAAAVIHSPEVLFLDEPFESVDASSVATMKKWLRNYAHSGRTVFFSSHVLDVVSNFCTHLSILKQGEVVWAGSTKDGYRIEGQTFADLEDLFLHFAGTQKGDLAWL
jgi:ABC-2 type transport system ATP-binding protein